MVSQLGVGGGRLKTAWLNRVYNKVRKSPGIKIKDLSIGLCSPSYTRELIKDLIELGMVRSVLEKPAGAYLLFDVLYVPPKPKPHSKPKNSCRTYKVPLSQVWQYRGSSPIPDELRVG